MMKVSIALVVASVIQACLCADSFSYSSFSSADLQAFQLGGDAIYDNPNSDGQLILTRSIYNVAGSGFQKSAVSLTSGSFSTAFRFALYSPAGIKDTDGAGADGLVFVINSVTNSPSSTGGGMGYYGLTKSVGIEFDTFYNPEVGDPNGNHIGVDINGDIRSVATYNVAARMNDGNDNFAWVDYNIDTKTLEIRYSTTETRPSAAIITKIVDIPSILGSTNAYVGFTAATGAAYNRHTVKGWTFVNTYAPVQQAPVAVCGNNVVESGEQCDGGNCCTSTCTFVSSSTVCRASTGPCDGAETCTGSAAVCPADAPTLCPPAAQYCADRINDFPGDQGYFCNVNGVGFYQCVREWDNHNAISSQSAFQFCAAGTVCHCSNTHQECSGTNFDTAPCLWPSDRQ